ncbi:MAG: ABC transporter permease [Solirubrobacteraceae bacterium]
MSAHASRPYGPSAMGGGARRFVELTMTLARSEFKLRYFGSALGYVWSLMRPLLFFGVLYLFFTNIIRFGAGIPHYGVYLLTSIVLWNFFAEATGGSVNCLITREPLVRKIRFPRMVIPLSVSLTATFNLGMNAIVVVIFALLNGVTPTVRWLEMIPIALAFIVFATGIGMLLSAAYVRYRDVAPIWEVLLQAWFYCSPIMYLASSAAHRFGTSFAHYALINPVGLLLTQMGHAFIGGSHFPAALTAASLPSFVAGLAIMVIIFFWGLIYFTREAPRVAENL